MSYCRFGPDSDVYVFHSGYGGWVINLQTKDEVGQWHKRTRKQALAVLEMLREGGAKVPKSATNRFKREIRERASLSTKQEER